MPEHTLQLLADYHAWTFDVLYAALAPLDDDGYRRDCGLFFKSIHGTLNHLLVGDTVWFGRCAGTPVTGLALNSEMERDRLQLERRLRAQSARWSPWLAALTPADLAGTVRYTNMAGESFAQPLPDLLLHVFNHGTHHRGQISAALTAQGHTAPEMDLVWYLRR